MSLIMKQKIYQFVVVILVIINSITLIAQVDYGDVDFLDYINTLFSVIFFYRIYCAFSKFRKETFICL